MQIAIVVDGGECIGTIYYNGKARIMMIDNVEVDKNKRHKGIGTVLMEKAIAAAKEYCVDSVELVANSDNKVAKGLYRKVGFQKTNKEHYRLILKHFV
jgi:ribosomal protein S18 acetylase RimI-like enzyme